MKERSWQWCLDCLNLLWVYLRRLGRSNKVETVTERAISIFLSPTLQRWWRHLFWPWLKGLSVWVTIVCVWQGAENIDPMDNATNHRAIQSGHAPPPSQCSNLSKNGLPYIGKSAECSSFNWKSFGWALLEPKPLTWQPSSENNSVSFGSHGDFGISTLKIG